MGFIVLEGMTESIDTITGQAEVSLSDLFQLPLVGV